MLAPLILLTAPLFLLVLLGYGLLRWAHWPKELSDALTRFVFSVAIPALLFRQMSAISQLPPPDWRLLLVFFGSCLLVFALGRVIAHCAFRMDGTAQSVFALGGIFSNLVLLGVPLSRLTLGDEAIPAVSLILVFNALILWTLVSVSVEWAKSRSASVSGLLKTGKDVLTNPIIFSSSPARRSASPAGRCRRWSIAPWLWWPRRRRRWRWSRWAWGWRVTP